jgi:hypothetical protein
VTTAAATLTETTQGNEKHIAVKDEEPAAAPNEEATDAADEVTVKGQKESAVDTAQDVIQAAKEPKTTPSSSTGVSGQGEVRGTRNETTTASAKVSNGHKKGDEGPTTKGATESSTDSPATNNDTGAKHEIKGGKKDGTGKKTK